MFDSVLPEKITSSQKLIELGQAVVETERQALGYLTPRVDEDFAVACEYLYECTGRVVITGMGKSGHIGGKIAATLASTGTPAFFVHPGEAVHGDLGMITGNDCVMAISNSGETDEILTILPLIKRLNIPLIALTGKPESTLAENASVNLDISVPQEACPLGLAPTASTTMTLVMGDALAIALLKARGFTQQDFAMTHPGGRLGRRLLTKVHDLMHTHEKIPQTHYKALLPDVLLEVTRKRFGMTTVVDDDKKLMGVFTDGDLRRTIDSGYDIASTTVEQVLTRNSKTIDENALASEALTLMEAYKIAALVIVNNDNTVNGVIHMHDLIEAKIA